MLEAVELPKFPGKIRDKMARSLSPAYQIDPVPTPLVVERKAVARDSGQEKTPLLEDALPANGDFYTRLAPETVRAVEDDSIPESAVSGRHLTLTNAYILVILRVIGTAIFATPGLILKSAGSIGLSMLLWVFGAILAATDLVVWLEYGCMLPRSGGHKVYLEFTYPHPGFLASTLVAVQSVLLRSSVGSCVVFGKYMLFAFDIEQTDFRLEALSSGLMVTVAIIHGCFHKFGVWLQDLIGWAKVFMIIIIALIGMYVVVFSQHGHHADTPDTNILNCEVFWKNSDWALAGISAALFKVTYAHAA
ncbi:hypothetical protein MAP00_008780 [Monascus purpureus]|nr:hypothetical protein MAP00_008780 [Monascus purpureus]